MDSDYYTESFENWEPEDEDEDKKENSTKKQKTDPRITVESEGRYVCKVCQFDRVMPHQRKVMLRYLLKHPELAGRFDNEIDLRDRLRDEGIVSGAPTHRERCAEGKPWAKHDDSDGEDEKDERTRLEPPENPKPLPNPPTLRLKRNQDGELIHPLQLDESEVRNTWAQSSASGDA